MSSSDARCYSKRFISEFIELYKSLPSLWKIKSKEYSDRNKKKLAYKKMVEKLKEVEPDASREMVTKKINSLRSSYRKEKKRVLESLNSGTGDVHVPCLWYFDLFHFLVEQDTSDNPDAKEDETSADTALLPVLKIDDFSEESLTHSISQEFNDEYIADPIDTTVKIPSSRIELSSTSIPSSPSSSWQNRGQNHNKRERERENSIDFTGKRCRSCDATVEDKHDVFGRHVANKLRNLPNSRRIHLEKSINDAIFEAELENLYCNE